ncbi:HD family phosphohydrolase [Alicyclobacillus sp. SO9]|uniref:HD family phosphohydrolase n=1 Tax=Alicyclobacillus sp. SO9 TaxID=2665646 RepID=UPI0018E8A2C4|nr:HDIG domain-containing metalloprotein [Alicyclobacillus sp. SO9]QQE77334.1 HDIG domain-containing protein [Alicyclobacillus sp. SO9]
MNFRKWGQSIRDFLDNEKFRLNRRIRIGIFVGLGLALYLVLIGSILPPSYNFEVGQTSPVTVRAPMTAVDTQATQSAKQAAENKVAKQYAMDPNVEKDAVKSLDTLFAKAVTVDSTKSMSAANKIKALGQVAPRQVTTASLKTLASMNPREITQVKSVSDKIVSNLLGAPFNEQSAAQSNLLVDRQLVSNYDLNRANRVLVQNLVVSVLKPNMVYQQKKTDQARQAAAQSVSNIMIHQGQLIVSKNGVITQRVLDRLKDVGLLRTQPRYGMAIGFALFVALSEGLLASYIERRSPRRNLDNLMLLLLAIIIVLMGVLIAIVKSVINAGGPQWIAYLAPISVGAMLITVLMDSSLAVVASFFLSLFFGAALDYNYWFSLIGFVGSLTGAYGVAKVMHRGTFMRAGFLVAMVNVLAITSMHLVQNDAGSGLKTFSLHFGLGALNGIFSAVLTMGILPFFEGAFGLLTAIRLLELSNPNHRLLKKVLMEAPGTYHHSLIVGNLAEAAAEIVGADPLICRVGAYYHDVGKTRRPLFFVENQMTKENPHDKIAPSLSHLIITSHVSDGLAMLKEAGLPKPIRDVCATHHGTTILWYFYNKAREQDKNGTVKVDDYRYPGPKPKTRENAIVMICDAVEAAVRSMSRPTPNRVEGVIRKIIRDRLEDGQLDECDLTLQDLDVMVGAFMKTLKGIYHSRIEYPDMDKIRKEVAK